MSGLIKLLSGALVVGMSFLYPITSNAQNARNTKNGYDLGKVIFTEYNESEPELSRNDLWIVDINGNNLRKLSDSLSKNALFSPDGSMIAFRSTNRGYRIIDTEGNLLHKFTVSEYAGAELSWSPDSKNVLFSTGNELSKYNLDNDTVSLLQPIIGVYSYLHGPVVSPNGNNFVFEYNGCTYNYYVMIHNDTMPANKNVLYSGREVYTDFTNLQWLNDSTVLFKTPEDESINSVNINSREIKIFPVPELFSYVLSDDKKRVAMIPRTPVSLKISSTADFSLDTIILEDTRIGKVNAVGFASNSEYFGVGNDDGLTIYDSDNLAHKCVNQEDFALGELGTVTFIDFDSKELNLTNLGSLKDKTFYVQQNYPNPFRDKTTIVYNLKQNVDMVELKIYDLFGKELRIMKNLPKTAGTHDISLDSQGLNTGLYVYSIESHDISGVYVASKKMILEK